MKNICLFYFFLAASLVAQPKLSDYKSNIYSQFGEDGIIEHIFSKIGISSKVCIEFGAADGFAFSNTANLWTKDPSWRAYLIESESSSFEQLVRNVANYPSCIPIHRAVGIAADDSLEAILKEYNLPETIDLLSIDVDGNDYYIFNSLQTLRPKVILCEYNPTIPAHLDIYPEYRNVMGCSVRALERIANQKGYFLASITDTNCIFLRNEELPLFRDYEMRLKEICVNKYLRYVFTDYAGYYQMVGESQFEDPYDLKTQTTQPVFGSAKLLSPFHRR